MDCHRTIFEGEDTIGPPSVESLVELAIMDLAREGETITGKNIAWKVNSAFKSYNVTNSQASRIAKRLPNVEISGKLGYSRTLGSGGSSALVFRYTGEIPKERVLLSSKEKKARRVGGYARHGLHKGEKE